MKYILLTILIWITFFTHFYGQSPSQRFNIRYETSVKGEMKIIGNNIVNRKDRRNKANEAFDDRSNGAKANDELNMQYIDIDDDSGTFSSSSANFSFNGDQNAKIIYAGLYWTATYPYASGTLKGGNYKIKKSNREVFDNVMIKLPSEREYKSVQGELIFDGMEDSALKGVAPYVCYADVTHLFTDSLSAEGEYVVANVRAANGYIAGGVAAGWALVLVYESVNSSEKKMITYDGFSTISSEPKTFNFSGFTTPKENTFHTRIMGAALEGDFSMSGDRVIISNPANGESLDLETKNRSRRNFFNSGITENDHFVTSRNPASQNTLGFDIFHFEVPDENQSIIPNSTSSLELTFTRSIDQYYLFLTALQIENVNNKISDNQYDIYDEGEYYVVVGAYFNLKNVTKQIQKMKMYGYKASSLYDEEKGLYYVYVEKFDTHNEALQKVEEAKAIANVSDAWVLKIKKEK